MLLYQGSWKVFFRGFSTHLVEVKVFSLREIGNVQMQCNQNFLQNFFTYVIHLKKVAAPAVLQSGKLEFHLWLNCNLLAVTAAITGWQLPCYHCQYRDAAAAKIFLFWYTSNVVVIKCCFCCCCCCCWCWCWCHCRYCFQPVSLWPQNDSLSCCIGCCFLLMAQNHTKPDQTRPNQTRPEYSKADSTKPNTKAFYAVGHLLHWWCNYNKALQLFMKLMFMPNSVESIYAILWL